MIRRACGRAVSIHQAQYGSESSHFLGEMSTEKAKIVVSGTRDIKQCVGSKSDILGVNYPPSFLNPTLKDKI